MPRVFVGDQHGREVEGIIDTKMEDSLNTGKVLTVRCAGFGVREMRTVHKVANATVPVLKVKVKGHEAEEIKLSRDPFQRIVTLKMPETMAPIEPEQLKSLQEHIRDKLGKDTMVLCLPTGSELDIIELHNPPQPTGEVPEGAPTRDNATWNF